MSEAVIAILCLVGLAGFMFVLWATADVWDAEPVHWYEKGDTLRG